MNGAESLVRTLIAGGVDTCFANPGTSEMHFVAALDHVAGMRCVLGLFEGVVTGAADGYGRMADKPAATLLHCGPGFGNAIANLHNARRANTPIVNVVGDHAVYHRPLDAPLGADVAGLAAPVSHWVRDCQRAADVARDGAAAVVAARTSPGQIATLILPANTAWEEGAGPVEVPDAPRPSPVDAHALEVAVRALRNARRTVILAGGRALRESPLRRLAAIAEATGARLMAQGSNARIERGQGRIAIERVPYVVEQALAALAGTEQLILLGAKDPVAFFAYPGKPGRYAPVECDVLTLARPDQDLPGAVHALSDALGLGRRKARVAARERPSVASGAVTPETLARSIGALLPDGAIVTDETVSSGRGLFPETHAAAPHDWLQITGGSIGVGLPLAVGAAVACPDRKVVALEADGSGMYTLQALWTMAREKLDVTVVIYANRRYAILQGELMNVGAKNPGRIAMDMLDIGRPDLDWVSLGRGMGVEGVLVDTMEGFNAAFADAVATRGPRLIEVRL